MTLRCRHFGGGQWMSAGGGDFGRLVSVVICCGLSDGHVFQEGVGR